MKTVVFAIFLAAAVPMRAQIVGSVPVQHFALPVFGSHGGKVWELRGAHGFHRAEGTVELESIHLRFFEPDGTLRLEMTGGRASLDPATRIAEGTGGVHLESPLYSIRGTDWSFDGARRRVTLVGGVRATFRQDLGSILE